MNRPPKTFKNQSEAFGLSDEKIGKEWLSIWEKTISKFLKWLIEENQLNNDQIIKLKQILEESFEKGGQKKSIMDLIKPVIRKSQRKIILNKFASLFVTNLDRYYQGLNLKKESNG